MTRVALINPNWNHDGSIYFACRAREHYVAMPDQFSDDQKQRPVPVNALGLQVTP